MSPVLAVDPADPLALLLGGVTVLGTVVGVLFALSRKDQSAVIAAQAADLEKAREHEAQYHKDREDAMQNNIRTAAAAEKVAEILKDINARLERLERGGKP